MSAFDVYATGVLICGTILVCWYRWMYGFGLYICLQDIGEKMKDLHYGTLAEVELRHLFLLKTGLTLEQIESRARRHWIELGDTRKLHFSETAITIAQ